METSEADEFENKTESIKPADPIERDTTTGYLQAIMKGYMLLVSLCLLALLSGGAAKNGLEIALKSDRLCSQCSKCDTKVCPPSESYPHMTTWDDSLIAGALQSDYVDAKDRGVYSVPDIKGGKSSQYNSYYGWKSTSGSKSGHHRFSNYMDKCSGGQSYLTADNTGRVSLRSLKSLKDIAQADWKLINPPKKLNHRKFGFWVNGSTGKCLAVFGGKGQKRTVGVSSCKFDGSNPFQLFAFRFHYHKTFCCCGLHNP